MVPRPQPMSEITMQYMLMLYVRESNWSKLTKAEQERGVAAYTAYTEALKKAGVFAGGNPLQPSSAATTVRVANGKSPVLGGPFAGAQEQLGGHYQISVTHLR